MLYFFAKNPRVEIPILFYHTTVTVFEPDVIRDGLPFDYIEYLLENDSNFELNLDIIKENSNAEAAYRQTEATTSEKEFSDNSISHPNDSVKKQLKKTAYSQYAPTRTK